MIYQIFNDDEVTPRLAIDFQKNWSRLILVLEHQAAIEGISISSDGTRIVSHCHNGMIRVWNADSGGELIPVIETFDRGLTSAIISPDGKRIFSGGSDGLHTWDSNSGNELLPLMHHRSIGCISISPDSMKIASLSKDGSIFIWDAYSGVCLLQFVQPQVTRDPGLIFRCVVAYSPDGRILASGYGDLIRVWDPTSGYELCPPLQGHGSSVTCISFSPDGRSIVSGSTDATLRLWDLNTGEEIVPSMRGHSQGILTVAFSPDGMRVVSGSLDHTVRFWDVKTGMEWSKPRRSCSSVSSIAFSQDGTIMVSDADTKVQIWDARQTEAEEANAQSIEMTQSVSFSPDGTIVAACFGDGIIRLYDSSSGVQLGSDIHMGSGGCVHSVSFSPDGRRLLSSSFDNKIRLWDVNTRAVLMEMENEDDAYLNDAVFSPDGRYIVSGPERIHLWDALTGQLVIKPIPTLEGRVTSIAMSPDNLKVLAVLNYESERSVARLWNLKTGSRIKLEVPNGVEKMSIDTTAFTWNSQQAVISSTYADYIHRYDVSSGLIQSCADPDDITSDMLDSSINPSGVQMTGTSLRLADDLIVDAFSKRVLSALPTEMKRTVSCWRAHGRSIVLGTFDGRVIVIHVPKGLLWHVDTTPGPLYSSDYPC